MVDFLGNILTFITSIVNLLINTLTSIFALISHIPVFLTFITSLVMCLPSFIIPFILAAISIFIVQYLINRRVD